MTATATPDRSALARLLDHHQITTLVHRLGAALDDARFDDLRQVFAEDATAHTPGGLAQGRDALIDQASRNHSPESRIQHVITDVLVDVEPEGDRATVRANLVVTFAGDLDVPPRLTMGEIYRFDAARTLDGWRLTSVRTTPVWKNGDLPVRRR